MKNNKYYILFLIVIAAVSGGLSGVFGKIALREFPPFSFTFLRFFLAAIFLLPFSIKSLPTFHKRDYKIILISILGSINVVLFSFGIKYTTAGINQTIYTAVPIVSAILSFYIYKERFNLKEIIGILIGFIGTAFIVFLPVINGHNFGSIKGTIIIFIAMLSVSLYWVLSKKLQNYYSPLIINNYFIFTTTILLFFLSFYDLLKYPEWYNNISSIGYLSLLVVAIFGTSVVYFLNQILIKKTTPVMASMVLYLQPFATFAWAYVFLSEKLTSQFLIGILLTLFGVGIYNYYRNFKNL